MSFEAPLASQPRMSGNKYDGIERYNRLNVLGEGTYGIVYRAKDKVSGKTVALKKVRLDRTEEGIPQTALREVSVLQEVYHPNIVNLLDVICTEDKVYLVFEYMEQDMKKGLERHGPYSGMDLKLLMLQMIDALYFCHRHRIIHRDLKPANILLSYDNTLKLADFGLARAFHVPMHTYTHEVVTLWYRAPEILLGEKHYTPAVDMWSVGCIFAELVKGKVLFRGDSEIGQLFEIFQTLGTPMDAEGSWPGVSKLPDYRDVFPKWSPKSFSEVLPQLDADAADLLSKMLKYDPAERISAKEALEHPWFEELRF